MALNHSLFVCCTEHFNRSFSPSSTTLWNDISVDMRCLKSISSFKKALFSFYNVPSYNPIYMKTLLFIDSMQFSTLIYV